MRTKIYKALTWIYGILLTVAFFAGLFPIVPFVLALILGGSLGENIALFLVAKYYPCLILMASVAIVVGVIAMYIGKKESLSVKKIMEK